MRGRFGFGFGGGRWARDFGFQCEPRMRRGDMKYLLLEILKEGPRHGYDIINGLEGQFRGYRRARVRFTRPCKCSKKAAT